MKKKLTAAASLAVAATFALSGCGGSSTSSADTVNIAGFSVLEQANDNVIKGFNATPAGADVSIKGSYGSSGSERDAVLAGQPADEVHLSLEPDVSKLVDAGIVAKDWDTGPTKGICTQSIVVFVVKPGNPENITTWADLTKPGVQIVTPDPGSSGSAKWNLLAAYGSVIADGGTDAQAQAYLKQFYANVVALPSSGRDATTAFESGTGNVLLSYENEAILAKQSGQALDYVIPDSSLLIQNPCAVTEGASPAATAFLNYQESAAGQKLYGETGFRPLTTIPGLTVQGANDPTNPYPDPKKLLNIDKDFGGWDSANDKYFGDGQDGDTLGIITNIENNSGVAPSS